MTTINWIFANVCYFILFIVDFPAYVVDNWTCEDMSVHVILFAYGREFCSLKYLKFVETSIL